MDYPPFLRESEREAHEGEVALVEDMLVPLKGLLALVESGPDDLAGEPEPPEPQRQVHIAHQALTEGLAMLDAGAVRAEVEEPHRLGLPLAGTEV